MHKFSLFLLSFFFVCHSFGQESPEAVLRKSAAFFNSKKSVSCKVISRMKFFNNNDTSSYAASLKLERIPEDSIFGARFSISNNEFDKIYDLTNIYILEKKDKKGTKYFPHKGQDWPINGNLTSGTLWNDFIEPSRILSRIDSVNKLELLKDTVIDKAKCYKVAIHYPDESEDGEAYTDQKRIMCINKKTYNVVYTSFQIKFQGNFQFNELIISDAVFDKLSKDCFSSKLLNGYEIEDYKEQSAEEIAELYKLLDSNSVAPILKGELYGSDEKLTEVGYEGKVTLLDFWYMACGWCIKSFPYIEKLHEKYGDKLQIYGVNMYDNNDKAKEKLPKFLEFNPMKYPTILVNEDFIEACKVKAWPTFYLIGPDGKIAYSHMGAIVSDEMLMEWQSAIDKVLE